VPLPLPKPEDKNARLITPPTCTIDEPQLVDWTFTGGTETVGLEYSRFCYTCQKLFSGKRMDENYTLAMGYFVNFY
jgi:hypothetical protein